LLQYRGGKDLTDPQYLLPRISDKLVVALIMLTLYLHKGNDNTSSNVANMTSLLFMWAILPGFAASSYIPSLMLERPLFIRCA
jgi:ATP-binding cassette, subfamily G (WHITE), member 2